MKRNLKFTFEDCPLDGSEAAQIQLESFQLLKPLIANPREWTQPTDRGDVRPTVINNALIQKAYSQHSVLNDQHRQLVESGNHVPFDEILDLKLEYLNIFHIENLEKLTFLKKLSLDNNVIESPHGLGALVHLEELDLSYNKLTTLASIHLLVKLRVLRVNNNQLRTIELLKYNHRSLEILNVAHNKLNEFWETLLYLSALPNLKSLAMDGNPLWNTDKAAEADLKIVLLHFLPRLRFYNHRIITSDDLYPQVRDTKNDTCSNREERKVAIVKRVVHIFKYEDPELIGRLAAIRMEIVDMDKNEEEAEAKLGLESVLDQLCLAGLRYGKGYDAMIEKDMEGQELMSASKRVKDEVYERLNESMTPVIVEITSSAIALFRARQVCIDKYIGQWENETLEHGKAFAERVNDFLLLGKVVKEKLLKAFNSDNMTEESAEKNMKEVLLYDKEFIILTKELWWDLMDKEMAIHGKLEDMFGNLDEELAQLARSYIDPFKNRVVTLRKAEEEFFEYLMDFMTQYVNAMATKKSEILKLSPHQRKVLFNSERRNNLMTQSHDNHSFFIDIEEENAIEQLKKWQAGVNESCRRIETENNRKEVDEINKLIVKLKSDWEDSVGEAIRTAYTFLWVVDPKWTKEIMSFKMSFEDRKVFDELESTMIRKTDEALEARKKLEKYRKEEKIKEAERQSELERKIRMTQLKTLATAGEVPPKDSISIDGSMKSSFSYDREKMKDSAMKEMAMLKEIDLDYNCLRNAVLNEQFLSREVERKKKERDWKMENDEAKLVHVTAGNNLKIYRQLRDRILDSGDDNFP